MNVVQANVLKCSWGLVEGAGASAHSGTTGPGVSAALITPGGVTLIRWVIPSEPCGIASPHSPAYHAPGWHLTGGTLETALPSNCIDLCHMPNSF